MEITIISGKLDKLKTELFLVPVFSGKVKTALFIKEMDTMLNKTLLKEMARQDFKGKKGQQVYLNIPGNKRISHLLLVGMGKKKREYLDDWRQFAAVGARFANKLKCKKMAVPLLPVESNKALQRQCRQVCEGLNLALYKFNKYKSNQDDDVKLKSVTLLPPLPIRRKVKHGLIKEVQKAQDVSRAVCLARDLINEPPNVLNPPAMAEIAQKMAEETDNLTCQILTPKEMQEKNMNLLLAVSSGSPIEPRLIHLHYQPPKNQSNNQVVALVGKGLTFDAGGLCLKPAQHMAHMKGDMGGGAVVIGAMYAISKLKPNMEVHGLVPASENMPGGKAFKMDDVITGMGKKSVEICNTDAEGRLILADALSYALSLDCNEIIDFATLTGACMVALGDYTAGVFGNNDRMVHRFMRAGQEAGEDLWRLPLTEALKESMKSEVADTKNIGSRMGGAIGAALFLQEFVENKPWIHVDIAGPAFSEADSGYKTKGGTGFGIMTALEYLLV